MTRRKKIAIILKLAFILLVLIGARTTIRSFPLLYGHIGFPPYHRYSKKHFTKTVPDLHHKSALEKKQLLDLPPPFVNSYILKNVTSIGKHTHESVKLLKERTFLKLVSEDMDGTTKISVNYKNIRVCISDTQEICLPVNEYKKWRANEFMKYYANPFKKSSTKPTLQTYTDDILRPNPLLMVKDPSTFINDTAIYEELLKEKKRRMNFGDEDISQIPQLKKLMNEENNYFVPNIVHFIWFNCHRYLVHHYISMMSAVRYQKPSLILFHTNCQPNGSYWLAFRDAAGENLKIVNRTPPVQIWKHPITRVEHQSDVARLHILLEVGGIYLDDDIVVLKSMDLLRSHQLVLGEENYDALANSVIIANKLSWFLRRWFQEYQNFDGSRWSDSSCFVPWSMWHLFPKTIEVVKEKMLRPNWEEIEYIYHELWDWRKSFTMHLYSRFMLKVDGTSERSLKELAVLNTTYGEVARHVVWGDFRIRNIEDWIL